MSKESLPLVSVLMPVYNASEFLLEAVNSVLQQSYRQFEFIIINDGSTDHSESIIKSIADERIRYFHQENCGVALSLNRGIELASGKYIWRHDADDISMADKLEHQVTFLENNTEYVCCSTQIAFMTERGKIANDYRQPGNQYFQGAEFVEVVRNQFAPYSPITHATVLIRTDTIRDLGGYRTFFQTAEDIDLWLRLLQKNKAAVLNHCDYFVRLNANSTTVKHGWKNEFFRNLAFKFFDQRRDGAKDDLQKGQIPGIPAGAEQFEPRIEKGKSFRGDLLPYLYPLHLDAKDWKGAGGLVWRSILDGWRLMATWKAILFPLLGKKIVKAGVTVKSVFK